MGEIGALMGLNANGSGYLGLDKVRIPRNQMLMKHSQVLEVYTINEYQFKVSRYLIYNITHRMELMSNRIVAE